MMQNLLQPKHSSQSSEGVSSEQSPFSRCWFIFILTGVLAFSSSLVFVSSAIAATPSSTTISTQETNALPTLTAVSPLPAPLANAVRRDLSKQTGIPAGKLRVVEANRKTWSNGCLELPKPDEFCMQALVEGWRVVLTDGNRRWVYRTDRQGRNIRLEPQKSSSNASLDVARTTVSQTDSKASIQPSKISVKELPPALEQGVVFRAIASGGITGNTYEATLWNDGRLVRVLMNRFGARVKPEVRYLSPEQVQQFQQIVRLNQMQRYHRLYYPAVPGSADFITVTVTSSDGTVRYADSVQDQLPASIRTIVQAWSEL